jgi:hypothetical protein
MVGKLSLAVFTKLDPNSPESITKLATHTRRLCCSRLRRAKSLFFFACVERSRSVVFHGQYPIGEKFVDSFSTEKPRTLVQTSQLQSDKSVRGTIKAELGLGTRQAVGTF